MWLTWLTTKNLHLNGLKNFQRRIFYSVSLGTGCHTVDESVDLSYLYSHGVLVYFVLSGKKNKH